MQQEEKNTIVYLKVLEHSYMTHASIKGKLLPKIRKNLPKKENKIGILSYQIKVLKTVIEMGDLKTIRKGC